MEQEDFHFYQDLNTALDNGDMFVLSKFQVLPRAGGWMDQDYYEAQDIKTYMRGYTWAYLQNHPKEGNDQGSNPLDFAPTGAIANIDDFVN